MSERSCYICGKTLCLVAIAAIGVAACDLLAPADEPFVGPPHFGRNNSAILTPAAGGFFGPGTDANADLAYSISVDQTGTDDVIVTDAVVMRTSTLTQIPYVVLIALNVSSTSRCFVETSSADFVDDKGTTVVRGSAVVIGSVGQLTWDVFTNTCLGPGEIGYFVFVFPGSTAYGIIAEVRLKVNVGENPVYQPAAKIIPQSGTWEDRPFFRFDRMEFELRNEGNVTGRISSVGNLLVLLETNGSPVAIEFLDVPTFNDSVDPRQTGKLETTTLLFDGTASTALVLVNFSDEAP